VLPVQFEGECLGVIELGSVRPFSALHLAFLERMVAAISVAITTIRANRRTEELLAQSQRLAMELQDQSAELQRANAELEEKAEQLSEQNRNVEIKNHGDRHRPGAVSRRRPSSWPWPASTSRSSWPT
jgi:transcriptional regulator with GAF, ATPase, and Fis domain